MKTFIFRISAALLLAASLAGCHTIQEETLAEWFARQPVFIDP